MYGSHSQPTEKNRWIECHNQLLELEKENEELRERNRYLEKIISEIVRTLKGIVRVF
jgi:predicted nuclease with TOPRIM domain